MEDYSIAKQVKWSLHSSVGPYRAPKGCLFTLSLLSADKLTCESWQQGGDCHRLRLLLQLQQNGLCTQQLPAARRPCADRRLQSHCEIRWGGPGPKGYVDWSRLGRCCSWEERRLNRWTLVLSVLTARIGVVRASGKVSDASRAANRHTCCCTSTIW